MNRSRLRGFVILGVAVAVCAAAAAPSAGVAQLPGQDAASARALAGVLLEVELALKERPPEPQRIADVNRAFDQASLAFFAGRVETVIAALASLVESVEPDPAVRERQRLRAREILDGLESRGALLEVPGGTPVRYRLHVPPVDGSDPLPVIVALHGAGGNEHMFLEAYGAGRIRELADERGFVVVSPATAALARAPEALPELLDAVAERHPIDRTRVYLVGHSMGAGAAWALAERFPALVAGVACIAGGCGGGSVAPPPGGFPRLLLVAGELDPLAAPARVEAAAAQARDRGVAAEYRLIPDQGHTLLVGAVLDQVVAWLLAHPPHH